MEVIAYNKVTNKNRKKENKLQLYRQGNYIARKSRYDDTIQVWNMRTMVNEFETAEQAIQWIEQQMKNKH